MNQRMNNFRGPNNRFGGPLVPFVLGGVVGSLWANNNNHNNYYPYPVYPYPVQYYLPYPYYNGNYYY